MKRFSLSAVSAGLALAIMSAPLALAQPYPNHGDAHGNVQSHSMPHTSLPHVTLRHAAPLHVSVQHSTMHAPTGHNGMTSQRPQARVPQPMHAANHMAPQAHQTAYSSHSQRNAGHDNTGHKVFGN